MRLPKETGLVSLWQRRTPTGEGLCGAQSDRPQSDITLREKAAEKIGAPECGDTDSKVRLLSVPHVDSLWLAQEKPARP